MDDLGVFGAGDDAAMALVMLSNGLSWLVGVGLQIALLAVVLTAVRRHRRDAAPWLVAAAAAGLVGAILGPALGWLGAFLGGELGIEAMLLVQALVGIGGTIVHAAIFLLLLRGIVALARPAA
jgi:hypothetical protein